MDRDKEQLFLTKFQKKVYTERKHLKNHLTINQLSLPVAGKTYQEMLKQESQKHSKNQGIHRVSKVSFLVTKRKIVTLQ